jgi:hypothetical protein
MTEERHASSPLVRRHLLWGWCGLFVFLLLGVVLEAFHALKLPLYLDVENETRRFLWRLAHAHGTLLSLLQIAAAWTLDWLGVARIARSTRLASHSLLAASALLPMGFFTAGLTATAGDPGIGIVLVPAGAVFLGAGAALFAAAIIGRR